MLVLPGLSFYVLLLVPLLPEICLYKYYPVESQTLTDLQITILQISNQAHLVYIDVQSATIEKQIPWNPENYNT
ncbi:hypothetical protein BDV37DRAFT_259311 [Aspergillus pseudonomiae]|uniref:Uncharacterized protein n=1 Tax=Aspergillus pseudonomiae TaxID=1506151 RepID=A0A5N7D0F1_9EURO|nr:uncharacterized protein BDV37DRAFT_259311 [Aspergillus pseudonomiae]KAE8399880.1 hypothetical protein BDV37DRAFT_259311 [Aspergillus pseudonomiae]